jgi:alpha-amylase
VKQAICLYLHVHQPFRIKHYTIFDAANDHNYFNDSTANALTNNEFIVNKVAEKSYLPTNAALLELLHTYPEFKISLSITGTILDQFEQYAPHVLESFQQLVATERVEIVAETYHHSLAFFYSRDEFEAQVNMHKEKIEKLFGQTPKVFRNTELSYNNELGAWADNAGYKGVITEGWDPILGWRSPNFVYKPVNTNNIRLLMKNYKLSDDMAFRFGDQNWSEWPLTAQKFTHWLNANGDDAQVFNLFMDYETFGEHQWAESGIFDFLKALPEHWLSADRENHTFMTLSEAIDSFESVDSVDIPYTITWADTERDLSAWLGNTMQHEAILALYGLQQRIMNTGDWALIEDWRRLQTSDHFYYMCTKWFNDGDIHAYFSPYNTPYEAFTNFMNAWHDLQFRLTEKEV